MKQFSTPVILVLVSYSTNITRQALSTWARTQGQEPSHTFPETGHTVSGRFLDYWNMHGGLAQQGFPISEPMNERSDTDGKIYLVQYFERAVFEWHPENAAPNDVLLSLLGNFLYKQKYPNGAPNQKVNTEVDAQKFMQTNHTVGGKFLAYWKSHGGLAQQGYPISEEFQEKSDTDGRTYRVQYFERAVFEWHPENAAPNDVLLSLLGRFRYSKNHEQFAATAGNLDENPALWDTSHAEIGEVSYDAPRYDFEKDLGFRLDKPHHVTIDTASGDRGALQFGLLGAQPGAFTAIQYRRKLTDYPRAVVADTFELDTYFQYRTQTPPGAGGLPPGVQALEFAMSVWRRDNDNTFRVYDWEAQWLPVNGPQWRMWAGCHSEQGWLPMAGAPSNVLTQNSWHHLNLKGTIVQAGNTYRTHYVSFTIDGTTAQINQSFPACVRQEYQGKTEQVANTHVQLDGTQDLSATNGYYVMLDGHRVTYSKGQEQNPQAPPVVSATPTPTNAPVPPTLICPTSPAEVARMVGGGGPEIYWRPYGANAWRYNENGTLDAPHIINGNIPAGTAAIWTTNSKDEHRADGPAFIPDAYVMTFYCPR